MNYFISKVITASFDDAVEKITATLKDQGFGIVTDEDLSAKLEANGMHIPKYRLLVACNPGYAHEAILAEPLIGVMLPCGVAVHELDGGQVEVAAIDPVSTMEAIKNDAVKVFAAEVKGHLEMAIANL